MSDVEESDNEIEEVDLDEVEADEDADKNAVKAATIKKIVPPSNSDEEDEEDEEDDDEDEDEDDDYDDEEEMNPEDEPAKNAIDLAAVGSTAAAATYISPINSDVESDDEDLLQKFDAENRNEYVKKFHPECFTGNSVEIESLTIITRNELNIIIDENHTTNPFLSKYEKTKILGQRTKQINMGHPPYINVPPNIIDGYLIAELELNEKKIPVIIRRPLPGGKSEYWKLKDLELI